MSRFNNTKRPEIFMLLLERDGPICQGRGCNKLLHEVENIDIDHLDNDSNNNQLSNLQLLCHSCNIKKGMASSRQAYVCVDMNKQAGSNGHGRDDMVTIKSDRIVSSSVRVVSKQTLEQEKKEAEALQAAKEDAALTPTQRVNKRCEKPFNAWMTDLIKRGWKYDFETWTNAGAQEFKCSPETIRKYLNKRTNPINGDLHTKVDDDGHGNKDTYLTFRDKQEN